MIEAIRHGIGRGVFIETVQLWERQNAFDGPRGTGDELCFAGPQTEIACLDLPLLSETPKIRASACSAAVLPAPFPPTIAVTPVSGEKISGSWPKQRKFLTVSVSIFILCPR